MAEDGTKLEHYTTPRIIIVSDGEAGDNWRDALERAKKNNIIIDCIGLISGDSGKKTLETIASSTEGFPPPTDLGGHFGPQKGKFILPDDLDAFLIHLRTLANKKYGSRQEDTVLCLDSSGSMSSKYKGSEKSRIDGLKEAVDQFVNFKNSADPRDRVAVVAFGTSGGDNVQKLIDLSTDKSSIMAKVYKLSASDGTPLGKGFAMSLDILDWENRQANLNPLEPIPISDATQVPSGTKCVYCEKTGGHYQDIEQSSFDTFSGLYNYGAWKCPKCGGYYHGGCFTNKKFTNGKWGMCYGCLTPLKVPKSIIETKYWSDS